MEHSRLRIMIKGMIISKHRYFRNIRNNCVENIKFHARGLCQELGPKFFDPSQSAVIIAPPLKNDYVIAVKTLIDDDPGSVVEERNTEFDDVEH